MVHSRVYPGGVQEATRARYYTCPTTPPRVHLYPAQCTPSSYPALGTPLCYPAQTPALRHWKEEAGQKDGIGPGRTELRRNRARMTTLSTLRATRLQTARSSLLLSLCHPGYTREKRNPGVTPVRFLDVERQGSGILDKSDESA